MGGTCAWNAPRSSRIGGGDSHGRTGRESRSRTTVVDRSRRRREAAAAADIAERSRGEHISPGRNDRANLVCHRAAK